MGSGTGRAAMTAVIMLAAVVGGAAQPREFAESQRANQAALRQYSWKSRTELKIDGESRQVRLEQVRYDIDGQLQKTVIGGSQPAADDTNSAPPGPIGGLKKRIVTKKKEAFRDMLAELAAIADAYAHMPPDRMKAFAARATMTPAQGPDGGLVRVQGIDVLTIGDQMTVWVEPSASAMRRVEIAASYEGRPVRIAADYRALANGTTYQARSTLRYPEKSVELIVETFDYVSANTR